MFLLMLAVILVACIILDEWKRRKLMWMTRDIKSIQLTSLPFLGMSHHFLGSEHDRMNTLKTLGRNVIKEGGIIKGFIGTSFYYVVSDPDIVEIALKTCLERGEMYKNLKILFRNGVVTSSVNTWRPHRKVISKVFNAKNLQAFVKTFSDQSLRMVEIMREKLSVDPIKLLPILSAYTMDSVGETVLGIQFNVQKSSNHPFNKAVNDLSELVAQKMLQPWLHSDFIYRKLPYWKCASECNSIISGSIEQSIQSKKELSKSSNLGQKNEDNPTDHGRFKSMIELLLQKPKEGKQFTDEEIRDESISIAVGGTDPSASALGFILSVLSRYPDVQGKVVAELNDIYGNSKRSVEAADLPKMKYLEAVIKETLRLFPPVPIIMRTIDKNVNLPSGRVLHKNTQLLVHIWGMHRDPRYWGEDAEIFRPERFLEPLTHNAYMPFNSGPRNCIGSGYAWLAIKTAVANVLRNFELLPAENLADTNCEDMPTSFLLVMKDVGQYNVRLKIRE